MRLATHHVLLLLVIHISASSFLGCHEAACADLGAYAGWQDVRSLAIILPGLQGTGARAIWFHYFHLKW